MYHKFKIHACFCFCLLCRIDNTALFITIFPESIFIPLFIAVAVFIMNFISFAIIFMQFFTTAAVFVINLFPIAVAFPQYSAAVSAAVFYMLHLLFQTAHCGQTEYIQQKHCLRENGHNRWHSEQAE